MHYTGFLKFNFILLLQRISIKNNACLENVWKMFGKCLEKIAAFQSSFYTFDLSNLSLWQQ